MTEAVSIRGLREFQSALKAVDAVGEIRRENKALAETVAAKARSAARARGSSAAKGVKSITASGGGSSAAVLLGGGRAPWMLGAEFGARRYKQFPPWRGNQWQPFSGSVGYFLHPTIRKMKDDIEQGMLDAVEKAAARAFPD